MDKTKLAFKSLENLFSKISDEELGVLVNQVDNVSKKGLSVDEYFSMVMSDYHHTFKIDYNNPNPIPNKILGNYEAVGDVTKLEEKIELVSENKVTFSYDDPNFRENYHSNDFSHNIAA